MSSKKMPLKVCSRMGQRWRAIIAITNKLLVGGQTAWSSFSGKVQPTHPELRPRGVSIEYFDQVRKHAF